MSDAVQVLHERNARVDADKAWESSKTRRAGIAILTYIVACLYMTAIGVHDVMLNALIPTCGFLLSTLSLGTIKKFWLRAIYQPKGLS